MNLSVLTPSNAGIGLALDASRTTKALILVLQLRIFNPLKKEALPPAGLHSQRILVLCLPWPAGHASCWEGGVV